MKTRVAVIGGSGFVGRSVIARLALRGVDSVAIPAPRLSATPEQVFEVSRRDAPTESLAIALVGFDVVINCAGNPDASSRDVRRLFGANGALPGVVADAARRVGARRFVHVSSAVVQGATDVLDASSTVDGHSAYARSKIAGEEAVRRANGPVSTVIYRPPSVHGPARRVTRSIRRLAHSPLASVVGNGQSPTPQAHVDNVGAAIAELALVDTHDLPDIVIHPWEGWTTADLMRVFGGGKEPLHIPAALAPAIRRLLKIASSSSRLAPNARRVEMMWFGQRQDTSWLTSSGWTPPIGREGWQQTLEELDSPLQDSNRKQELHGD